MAITKVQVRGKGTIIMTMLRGGSITNDIRGLGNSETFRIGLCRRWISNTEQAEAMARTVFLFLADDVIVSPEVIVSPGQREGRRGQEQRGKASSTAASELNPILLKSSHNTARSSAVFPRNYLLLESTSALPPPGTLLPSSNGSKAKVSECVAHSSSEQPRAHDMVCRRLTLLTRISVRVARCLGFHVRSKSEATTARPTSWAQAEGHRPRGFLVNPKHSLLPPVSFYYHLPINIIVLADLDVGSPLTSTVTSFETSALHCATLPHTIQHASHVFHAPVARSHRRPDPESTTTVLVYQVRQVLWQSQHW